MDHVQVVWEATILLCRTSQEARFCNSLYFAVPPLPFHTRKMHRENDISFLRDFTAILGPPEHWEALFMYRRRCCSQLRCSFANQHPYRCQNAVTFHGSLKQLRTLRTDGQSLYAATPIHNHDSHIHKHGTSKITFVHRRQPSLALSVMRTSLWSLLWKRCASGRRKLRGILNDTLLGNVEVIWLGHDLWLTRRTQAKFCSNACHSSV